MLRSPSEARAVNEAPRIKHRALPEGFFSRARSWVLLGFVLLGPAVFVFGWYWNYRRTDLPRRGPSGAAQVVPNMEAELRAAQEKLKGDPQDLGALVRLGVLYFEKGKEHFPDAINALEEARDLGALDARVFYCLGMMYQELGLSAFAVDEYRRYLRNNPEDREIRLLTAKLLYQQGRYPEAVGEYERLKFQQPNDRIIEENLGLSLWAAKQYGRAAESFAALKTYGPVESRRAAFYQGQLAFDQMLYNAALKSLLEAVPGAADAAVPEDRLQSVLAATYQKMGRGDEARASWEKVLALSPKDVKAQVALRDLNRRNPPKKPKPAKKA
ncbi:MAG: tetratricopeptide repeat protein [Elusimicrobia bacterium]|nr:tetratricopeptide repeat protein [Elusimicrobiota bacterium]